MSPVLIVLLVLIDVFIVWMDEGNDFHRGLLNILLVFQLVVFYALNYLDVKNLIRTLDYAVTGDSPKSMTLYVSARYIRFTAL